MNKFKSILVLIFVLVFQCNLHSQTKIEYAPSYDIILEAYQYQDAGKYEEAIELYEKVYEGDSLFFLYALPQKMTCYVANEEYDKARELGLKYWYFRDKLPTEYYLVYGTALDNLEEYEEVQEMYTSVLKEFPTNYSLWYNYAISLSLSGQHDKAYDVMKKTVMINPFYDRIHYLLGLYSLNEKQTSKALMSFGMYLILSSGERNNLEILRYVDYIASAKYWEDDGFSGSNNIDLDGNKEFAFIDELVHNQIAISKKYKTKIKINYPLVKQFHLIFSQLESVDTKSNHFWDKYYAKFYRNLMQEDHFNGFSCYVSQDVETGKVAKVVEKNTNQAKNFYSWAMSNIENEDETINLDYIGYKDAHIIRESDYYSIAAIGDFDYNKESDIIIGAVDFYRISGRKSASGNFNSDGKKQGKWEYYYPNGKIKEVSIYDNDEYVDSSYVYYDNGLQMFKAFYSNEEEGVGRLLTYTNGILSGELPFKDGETVDGKYYEYYPTGDVKSEIQFVDDKMNGEYIEYYDSGEILAKGEYVDGVIVGEKTTYYRNGQIETIENYIEGVYDGPYTSYYENGQILTEGNYKDGKQIGEWNSYYKDGKLDVFSNFDENGKETGVYEQHTDEGWKLYDLIYQKGDVVEYKFYDKDSNVLSEGKRKGGDFYFESFYDNGNPDQEGIYGKKDKNGIWKKYDRNGNLLYEEEYKDGVPIGEYKKYFINGQIETKFSYNEDGEVDGYYEDYYRNGNLYVQGHISEDNEAGPWMNYYRDKTVSSQRFYIDGEIEGFYNRYSVAGLLLEKDYYEEDLLKFTIYCDTAGNAIDTIFEVPGPRKFQRRYCKDCHPYMEVDVFNNVSHGTQKFYFPNGNVSSYGEVFNGNRHGPWVGFFNDGSKSFEGSFYYGERDGDWVFYFENGNVLE